MKLWELAKLPVGTVIRQPGTNDRGEIVVSGRIVKIMWEHEAGTSLVDTECLSWEWLVEDFVEEQF